MRKAQYLHTELLSKRSVNIRCLEALLPKQKLAIYSLKKNAKLLSKLSFIDPLFVVKKVLLCNKSLS